MESSMDPMEAAIVKVALRDVEPAFGYIAEAVQSYWVHEEVLCIAAIVRFRSAGADGFRASWTYRVER